MIDQPDRAERSDASGEAQRPAPAGGDGPGAPGAAANLGEIMGQVARSLQEQHGDVESTLEAITSAAVGSVPGAEYCGVTLVIDRKRVESRAPTGDLPRQIDVVQQELREGPCFDAVFEHSTFRLDDPSAETRWPRFLARTQELGLGSMLSFQLFVTGGSLGALNMYATRPHAFGEESESIGLVFATHGAVALAGAQHEQRLRRAVDSRDLIGIAKGILMERYKVTADRAFHLLVHASSVTNRKLVDIAEELSATGTLPVDLG
jgi:ANTAR domain/GAF domain